MNRWDKHWFGPVAAIRPYLFQKCFLLLIAFDLLVLMVERGGRYGLDSVPFNVPHFRWLNDFHAMFLTNGVPDATFYVTIVVLTSFFAFCLVLAGHRAWLCGIVCLLYTYAWSMSRLDSYLHHYMLSLILLCMTFFPAIDARSLRAWSPGIASADPGEDERKKSKSTQSKPQSDTVVVRPSSLRTNAVLLIALAVGYRVLLANVPATQVIGRWAGMFGFGFLAVVVAWLFGGLKQAFWASDKDCSVPVVNSWAVRLLATTVGVIYVFTSIAKMDGEWCGGHTLRQVGTTADVLLPVEQLANSIGVSSEWFWAGLATFVIPLEIALASIYLLSARQDEPNRPWLRRICMFGWLLAVGLHLNNEMMNLVIQWFGYYMLLLASVLLLPANILMVFGAMFYYCEAGVRDWLEQRIRLLSHGGATVAVGVVSMLAFVSLIGMGFYVGIMGAIVAGLLLGGLLVITLVLGLVAGWERRSLPVGLAALASSLLMILAVGQCSARFDYYDLRGKTLQQLGDNEAAIREMELAMDFPIPTAAAESELLTNLALANRRMGSSENLKSAERYYRRAISVDSKQFLAHYSLANLLVSQQRLEPAEKHYRAAIRIKSDFSDAYVNLGNLLEFQGNSHDAISCYGTALEIEPDAEDIQQLLMAAEGRLAASEKQTDTEQRSASAETEQSGNQTADSE